MRSPEVTAERPARALELLLGVWLGQPEIRPAFRAAVEAVAAGADPQDLARPAGTGERRRVVAGVLARVGREVPGGRNDAALAARCVRDWRSCDPCELDDLARQLLASAADRDLDELDVWAFEFAAGRARSSWLEWADGDEPGNAQSLRSSASLTPWSEGAITLGRRFAGVCVECGEPLGDRRVRTASGRTARRDYHDRCDPPASRAKQRAKAVERLLPLVGVALDL